MALLRLVGIVSSDNIPAVRPVLVQRLGKAAVTDTTDGLHVEATVSAAEVRDAHRELLSALRRAERRTRIRAEWADGALIYRFFDYVLKGTRPATPRDPAP